MSKKWYFKATYLICLILLCLVTIIGYNIVYSEKEIKKNEESAVIKIWTIHGDLETVLTKVTDEYTQKNPNVTFEISSFKNDVYKSNLKNSFVTNESPDMFFIWGNEVIKEYVDLGLIKDITDLCEVNNIKEEVKEGSLDSFTFENRIYGLPVFGWNLVLYANETIFNENNIKIPENYNELVYAIDEFKKKNIVPMALGAKESYTISFYYMMLALNEVGIDGVKKAIEDNSNFNEPGFLEAAIKLKSLVSYGAFPSDSINMDSYNSDYLFRGSKAAMTLNGTWLISYLEKDFKDIGDNSIKIIDWSKFVGKEDGIGGYVDGIAINNTSANFKIIEKIYIDLMKEVSKVYIQENGGGIPIWKDSIINNEIHPLLYEVNEIYKDRPYHAAYDQVLPPKVVNNHLESLKELVEDSITPEKFIENHIKK